jgi:hypothetical protein
MKTLRYICCQPAIPYYTWQVETLINNFKKHGVNPNHIDIVCGISDNNIPDDWVTLQQHYNTIRFFFYNDTREDKSYIPSIYFNLLKQHIVERPEIKEDVWFLHDCDIVLTRPPQFNDMIVSKSWYLSDTNSYINYDYIIQKGEDTYNKMCEIVGIDTYVPKIMNRNSGGAQYIVKDTTFEFWDKVEKDSALLYDYFCKVEPNYNKNHDNDYPIQKWCAGMWAFLWNAWKFGHETIVDKRLDFGWSTNNISDVENYPILHNAGVLNTDVTLFFKGNYINELPYGKELDLDENRASYYYWQQVCEAANVTCLNKSE